MKPSIITINRNNAPNFVKTLASVAAQTSREFEYLVFDGASTDGRVEVNKQYAGKFSDIPFHLINGPDLGIYHAMNKVSGWRMANTSIF